MPGLGKPLRAVKLYFIALVTIAQVADHLGYSTGPHIWARRSVSDSRHQCLVLPSAGRDSPTVSQKRSVSRPFWGLTTFRLVAPPLGEAVICELIVCRDR